jgi:hypothetical protein
MSRYWACQWNFVWNSWPSSIARQLIAVQSMRGADLTYAERELFDDVVNELDCIGLGVFGKDFTSASTPLRPRLQRTGTVAL